MVNKAYDLEKEIQSFNIHKLSVLAWYIIRAFLNIFMPIMYRFYPIKESKPSSSFTKDEVIVSLTTIPSRINKLYLVLEGIYRQTVRPDRVILWLANDQFSDPDLLKAKFKKYIEFGLEIRYCDNLRSHKKYYYSIKNNSNSIIITLDDDIFYPTYLLEELLNTYNQHPKCIVCMRAHLMVLTNGNVAEYNNWKNPGENEFGPSMKLFPTTGAGCLFPPGSLPDDTFDIEVFEDICFFADDVWLKCMSYINNVEVVRANRGYQECFDIIGSRKNGLASINVENNLNDSQLLNVTKKYSIIWDFD